jgi:hypothetical protein
MNADAYNNSENDCDPKDNGLQTTGRQGLAGFSTNSFTALRYENGGSAIQPFSRNIFLLKTNAAGCHHVENIEQHLMEIEIGQKLMLLREPRNPVDKRAILIMNGEQKLGYIPRRQNEILARLMDAGKYLYATADDKLTDWEDDEFYYAALTISVYMQD